MNNSKTTFAGVAMLLIIAVCLTLLILGRFSVSETALAIGILSAATISALGHIFAEDANAEKTISKTTVRETDTGKVVKVETELPEGK